MLRIVVLDSFAPLFELLILGSKDVRQAKAFAGIRTVDWARECTDP